MLFSVIKSIFSKKLPHADEADLESRIRTLLREKNADLAAQILLSQPQALTPSPEWQAWMGEVEYHRKNPAEAERLFLEALRRKPRFAAAHYGLSMIHYDAGRHEDALAQAQYACLIDEEEPRFLAQLGLSLIATQSYAPAHKVLRKAALKDPENVSLLNNLGIALHAMGDLKEASFYWNRALSIDPEYQPARQNLATTGLPVQDERLADAEGATTQPGAIEQMEVRFAESPDDVAVAVELIRLHMQALDLEQARDVLTLALEQHPAEPELFLLQARMAHQLRAFKQAQLLYENLLQLDPENVKALLGLTQVLRDQCKYTEALMPAEQAVALSASVDTLTQLAFTQVNACQYEQALATCDRAQALNPNMEANLHTSRAVCHTYLGDFQSGKYWLSRAQEKPFLASGLEMFEGMIHLLHGDYANGWRGYRLRALSDTEHQRLLPYARWQGESLQGKCLLVLAEQGVGDQIMFASCLPDLMHLGARKIVLEAHKRVAKTLARSFPEIEVHASNQTDFDWLPADAGVDYYVASADLPGFFRNHENEFPQHQGYLRADPERVAYWRTQLGEGAPRVGFSWRGGVAKTRQAIRSLQLEQLLPVFSTPGVRFVNLQYGDVSAELRAFSEKQGLNLLNFPEAIQDLDEFAALVCALDLVVTVCNTTVHYAGALNRPCWVMTPYVPEWRYGLTFTTMPWYPSTHMFRQPANGDWESVIVQVQAGLLDWKKSMGGAAC